MADRMSVTGPPDSFGQTAVGGASVSTDKQVMEGRKGSDSVVRLSDGHAKEVRIRSATDTFYKLSETITGLLNRILGRESSGESKSEGATRTEKRAMTEISRDRGESSGMRERLSSISRRASDAFTSFTQRLHGSSIGAEKGAETGRVSVSENNKIAEDNEKKMLQNSLHQSIFSICKRGGLEDSSKKWIEGLIKDGVDLNSTDKNGNTPLTNAALSGNTELAKFLLAHKNIGIDPNVPNTDGFRPLDIAARSQDNEMVDILMESGAERGAGEGEGKVERREHKSEKHTIEYKDEDKEPSPSIKVTMRQAPKAQIQKTQERYEDGAPAELKVVERRGVSLFSQPAVQKHKIQERTETDGKAELKVVERRSIASTSQSESRHDDVVPQPPSEPHPDDIIPQPPSEPHPDDVTSSFSEPIREAPQSSIPTAPLPPSQEQIKAASSKASDKVERRTDESRNDSSSPIRDTAAKLNKEKVEEGDSDKNKLKNDLKDKLETRRGFIVDEDDDEVDDFNPD